MNNERCEQYCYQKNRSIPQVQKKKLEHLDLVLFDMDGVLTDTISSWRYIHTHFGVSNDESVQAYISGEIDDIEFMRRDVDLWRRDGKLIDRKELEQLLEGIPLMNGAKTCISFLHDHGVKTAIVSAGLDILANRVADELGIRHVYANGIKHNESGGLTTEGILRVPLMYKDRVVRQISSDLHVTTERMAAVGNSCYDIPMLQAVSLGVAFNPSDECICENADLIVMGKNLEELLVVFKRYL